MCCFNMVDIYLRKFLIEGDAPCYNPEKQKKEVERLRKQLDDFEKCKKRQEKYAKKYHR